MGLVFIFSGFVKALDPLGSNYKFIDYFEAFGMSGLAPLALYLGILMAAAELVIGLCLIMGVRMKVTGWALLLFMSFFTVLTFFLAIFNPVSDCGCFGDAIKLTNWQTFFKNLAMFPFVLLIFFCRGQYKNFTRAALEWFYVALFFFASFALSAHCMHHLPVFDFMPYHVGQNIPEAMAIPEGAPRDEYRTMLIYEKDGKQHEFTDADYPWQDTTWRFIDSKSVLVNQGYTPPVYNFSITHPIEGDITESILEEEYAFLFVAPKLEKSSVEHIEQIKQLATFAKDKGYTFVGLTASTQGATADFSAQHHINFDICSTDETTLKSMVRAHPGVMLLYHGTVVGKWNANDLPSTGFFSRQPLAADINALRQDGNTNLKWAFIFATLVAMLLMVIINNKTGRKKIGRYA
jgi:uncharacterized membrane protein YphA (DoxX/SURF4 family)